MQFKFPLPVETFSSPTERCDRASLGVEPSLPDPFARGLRPRKSRRNRTGSTDTQGVAQSGVEPEMSAYETDALPFGYRAKLDEKGRDLNPVVQCDLFTGLGYSLRAEPDIGAPISGIGGSTLLMV